MMGESASRLKMGYLVRPALAALNVACSLMAGLAVRFLVVGPTGVSAANSSYWGSVSYLIAAFKNVLIPGVALGLLVFPLYTVLSRSDWVRNRFWVRVSLGICAFSVYYLLVGGYVLLFGAGTTYPRVTWALAWGIGLIFYVAYKIARNYVSTLDRFRPRVTYTRTAQLLIDIVVIVLSFAFSYVIRFDGIPSFDFQRQFLFVVPYVVFLYLLSNQLWGVHSFIWRFTSLREAAVLFLSVSTCALFLLVLRIVVFQEYNIVRIPFGVLIVHPVITYMGLLGVRSLRRIQFRHLGARDSSVDPLRTRNVLLVGAGYAGVSLLQELQRRPEFRVVGFLDDDPKKQNRVISGVRVLGTTRDVRTLVSELDVNELVFSMPTAPKSVVRRVAVDCDAIGLRTSSVPSMSEIVLGKVRVGQLRPVRMEDLLGRASIEFPAEDRELVETYTGKRILVTGAAGSIGSEIVRQLRDFRASELILVDKDENGLYEVALEIREEFDGQLHEVMADVRDRRRLNAVYERYKPQAVLHAAAYKHVPMMEHNPSEAILNNVLGTKNVVELASEHGVKFFLLISTDKAINPTNIMGASKRVAEMIVRQQTRKHGKLRGCCVRFGNVLGSRASVVPLFQKRILQGKNIQVTHEEIRRYFMTIPEAVQLVLQAGSIAKHGETFVLDMGDPVKIVDLARGLIEQSGLVVGEDIEIEFTGLRPGEKLYEELLIDTEKGTRCTKYPKIFVDPPAERDPAYVDSIVSQLAAAAEAEDHEAICSVFESLGIGYKRQIVPLERRG